jgi:hypothetical protein
VERGLLHKKDGPPFSAPAGLAPVERGLAQQQRWGAPNRWCRSLRSTGASPVGATHREALLLCKNPRSTGASPVGRRREGVLPFLCRSPCSTGASPVGAVQPDQSRLGLVVLVGFDRVRDVQSQVAEFQAQVLPGDSKQAGGLVLIPASVLQHARQQNLDKIANTGGGLCRLSA